MKDKGFRFGRVGTVPAKALTEEKNGQRNFLKQELEPRPEEAKAGKRVVYFADVVHFVYGSFVACLWSLKRIFMPSPSGGNRYNALGTVEAISHDLITVCNTTYINALNVCELLEEIALRHLRERIPVTAVPDNARYQRCVVFMRWKRQNHWESNCCFCLRTVQPRTLSNVCGDGGRKIGLIAGITVRFQNLRKP